MTQKITKIEAQQHHKDRYNIYLDETYAFPVADSVLVRFALAKGQELTEQEIETLKAADDQAKAYSKALDYIAHQLRTTYEVKHHLYDKGYTPETVDAIIDKLMALNYLDDEAYTHSYIRTEIRLSKKGPRVIQQKLRQKGIKADQITNTLAEEYPFETQVANGLDLVTKLSRHGTQRSFFAQKQKIRQQLMQKGFDGDVITAVLDQADLQKDEDSEQTALSVTGEKLWRRYANQPKGIQKLKQGLYRKGFALDAIQTFIDQKNTESGSK